MFWRTNERDFAHSPASSETAFENAASQFASIDIPAFRENALKELESAKRASPRAPTEQAKFMQAVPGRQTRDPFCDPENQRRIQRLRTNGRGSPMNETQTSSNLSTLAGAARGKMVLRRLLLSPHPRAQRFAIDTELVADVDEREHAAVGVIENPVDRRGGVLARTAQSLCLPLLVSPLGLRRACDARRVAKCKF
jgi:hypothetical protein